MAVGSSATRCQVDLLDETIKGEETLNIFKVGGRTYCATRSKDATRNKCIATRNRCLTSSNKKLLGAPGLTTRITRSKDATIGALCREETPNRCSFLQSIGFAGSILMHIWEVFGASKCETVKRVAGCQTCETLADLALSRPGNPS